MDVIPDEDLNETNVTLKQIYRIFPPFCLSDSFRGLATRDVIYLWGEERSPWDWEVSGRNLTIMAVEACDVFTYRYIWAIVYCMMADACTCHFDM